VETTDVKQTSVWLTRAVAYVTYGFLGFTGFILVQGFFLKLLGANPTVAYTRWAYRSLDRVMAPFRGIFPTVEFDGDAVLDTSILFALVIYGLLALVVRAALDWLNYRLAKLERQRQTEEREHRAAMAAPHPSPRPQPWPDEQRAGGPGAPTSVMEDPSSR
jgi:hypothetical protein